MITAYELCGCDGNINLRIPYQLLADMLVNCKRSEDRDELIRQLRRIKKSHDLSACLNRNKIWDLVDIYW